MLVSAATIITTKLVTKTVIELGRAMTITAGDSSDEVLQCGYTWELDDLGACIAIFYFQN